MTMTTHFIAGWCGARLSRIPKHQRGLTLIEILVALAIGLFMLIGIVSLVVSVSQTRVELDKSSEQIENGRYAIQLLSDEIRLAGFYGASQLAIDTYSDPDPCATAIADLGIAYDAATNHMTAPLPVTGYTAGSSLPACLASPLADTEAIVIRRASTSDIAASAAVTGRPYMQLSGCADDTTPVVFSATPAAFTLYANQCTTAARLWPYGVKTFFIASCNDCASDNIPTLKVRELVNGAQQTTPLVEGVEDMHFEYGVDADDNGSPDCYTSDPAGTTAPAGCTAGWGSATQNWSNVTAIKVSVLARSIETTPGWSAATRTYDLGRATRSGPFTDSFKRQVYSAVITIPNVAGARE